MPDPKKPLHGAPVHTGNTIHNIAGRDSTKKVAPKVGQENKIAKPGTDLEPVKMPIPKKAYIRDNKGNLVPFDPKAPAYHVKPKATPSYSNPVAKKKSL